MCCVLALASGCSMFGGGDKPDASAKANSSSAEKVNADVTPASPEALVEEAGYQFQAGNKPKALSLLRRAAKLNPVDAEPWLRIAQVQFDAQEYGEAIVAAEEVLRRDPANRTGNGIIAVSGLRIAADSVLALRKSENLEGSVRTEAESLAQKLRRALGEESLVPLTQQQPAASKSPAKAKAPPKQRVKKSTKKPVAAKAKPSSSSSSGSGEANPFNPFETLQELPE